MLKNKRKRISLVLLIIILISSALQLFPSKSIATTTSVNYLGQATYGGSIVGNFQINGRQAFCMEHAKATPPTGTVVTQGTLDDDNIAKCLYYGWTGEKQWNNFTSSAQGIVFTSLAIDHFKNGHANNIAKSFINYVESMPSPQKELSFSQNNVTAYIEGDIQRTPSILVNGDANYSLTLHLQNGVTLVNETKRMENAGTAVIYGGDTIYLKAPLSVNGTWISENISNSYKPQVITYTSANPSFQALASGYNMILNRESFINLTVNWIETGNLELNKIDADTNLGVSNTTFEIKNENGEIIGDITTDSIGYAILKNLKPGVYTLTEIKANDNYILDTTPIQVTINAGQTTKSEIINEHKKGNLKIYKVDKDNNKIALGNVEFKLYSVELDKIIGTYRTDVNGEIEIKNLRIGDYKLIETQTNKWYDIGKDKQIEIKWNIDNNQTIENELKKGQVKVIKVDKDNNEIKLEGIEFQVLDKDNNVLETIVTNKNGEALTSRYALRDFPQLKLRETKTLETYVLSDDEQTVELKENQISNIIIENEKIKGRIEVTKIDSKTKETLQGVEFGIYNENDELVQKMVTDSNGKAKSGQLPYGKYYLKELDTGSDYYILNETNYEFEIVENNKTLEKTIENDSVDIKVTVDKEGTTEVKPKEKVNYMFSNVGNASNTYLDSFKWYDYIPTDYIRLETMTTGTWNQDLYYDVYYKTNKSENYVLFKEKLSTQENYNLDFTTIQLDEDEYIIETCFDFGKVDKGFRESITPTMQCQSLDNLQDGQVFTNHTKTVGIYHDIVAESNSKWTTIVHIPKEKHDEVLPRTGKFWNNYFFFRKNIV